MNDIRARASLLLKKSTRNLAIQSRKLLYPLLYQRPAPNFNIYHCCIQKTATQWFSKLLTDRLIWKRTGFSLYYPGQNFITGDQEVLARLKDIPRPGIICSPLYIQAQTFAELTRGDDFRAFYILRDPRDIIVSNYFSMKYSHPALNEYLASNRRDLGQLSEEDGIMKVIVKTAKFISQIMHRWKMADDPRIKTYKFEDVFGPDQFGHVKDLFAHCRLALDDRDIRQLLDQYSFQKMSGRQAGTEDQKHHYRKGVSGDWKNYFTAAHKECFNREAGELLVGLGYEKDLHW